MWRPRPGNDLVVIKANPPDVAPFVETARSHAPSLSLRSAFVLLLSNRPNSSYAYGQATLP